MHILFGCFIGAIIGSLVNMLSHRIPIILEWQEKPPKFKHFNLFLPPSHCPKCLKALKIHHNIPIISYLFLKGQCAYCGTRFGMRYFMVEVLCLVIGGFIVWLPLDLKSLTLLYSMLIITMTLVVIDWELMLLPDVLTGLLLWSALLLNALSIVEYASLKDAIVGAAAGYFILWFINLFYKLIRKKDGMGQGDFKLLAAWGAWLGWYALPNLIIIASCAAIAWYLIYSVIHAQFNLRQPVAFGPWLCLGGFSLLLIASLK